MLKVSYLIGLYNKESFIIDCINSILNEDSSGFDIEIIVVDDGSTDNSLKLVRNAFSINEKVHIHAFENNKGKNAAYNEAFKRSTGSHICIFGADDIVINGRTKLLLDCSLSSNKAVYGGLVAKSEDLNSEIYRVLPQPQSLYTITMANGLSGGCCIIPRPLCENIFPIPENLKFEDWWLSYFLVKYNNYVIFKDYVSIYRIGKSNDCAYVNTHIDDLYNAVMKDYKRHIDYLNEFIKIDPDNIYLKKSKDIRKAFLNKEVDKLLYFNPLDRNSLKIVLFSVVNVKIFYRFLNFAKKCI